MSLYTLYNTNKILRIFVNSNNDTISDDSFGEEMGNNKDYPEIMEELDRHPDYLGLLVIDLLIFIGLTVICYSSSKKLNQKANTASIADDFKPKFVKGLVYANGSKPILKYFHSQSSFFNNYHRITK
jgi:hypothetical protein